MKDNPSFEEEIVLHTQFFSFSRLSESLEKASSARAYFHFCLFLCRRQQNKNVK